MEQLAQMIGTWTVVSGILVNGVLQEGPPTQAVIEPMLGGKMLIERGAYEAAGRRFEPVNIYSFDPFRERYRVASLDDTEGLMDVYEGARRDGCLRITNTDSGTWFRRPDGSEVHFMVAYCFEPDRILVEIDEADVGTDDWAPFMTIRYQRAG